LSHSIGGIRTEMHHDLVHLGRIREDRARTWLPVVLERDGARERRPQERQGFTNNLVELHRLTHGWALAAEGQQLLDDLLGSQSSLEDLLQIVPGSTFWGDIIDRQLSKTNDGRQDIVELMGDPCG
jgi:hypothetical protein